RHTISKRDWSSDVCSSDLAIGSVLKKSFPFKEHHEKECEQCGSLYKLYETPKGIVGACKHCMDQQLLEELNVPTKEERERLKEKDRKSVVKGKNKRKKRKH